MNADKQPADADSVISCFYLLGLGCFRLELDEWRLSNDSTPGERSAAFTLSSEITAFKWTRCTLEGNTPQLSPQLGLLVTVNIYYILWHYPVEKSSKIQIFLRSLFW